ncbi:MAG: 2,3-bisphosphoglycerate-independent phosphoglycerate mutase [Victivallaceae bacterium]|nr:2,3-bisphosphoglycerate-independent phosphoglycerate mutase [Victivallaceae bacterium]
MLSALKKNPAIQAVKGPVVLAILDGVGFGKYQEGDAFLQADTPELDHLMKSCRFTRLKAHGLAVGMPSDEDMGNSEVGHNAIGCGRVFSQGAKLVDEAVTSGKLFEGATWKELIDQVREHGSALHLLGLFSDGNVHSNISHLRRMIEVAAQSGVKKIRVHALLDGRDVPETSALEYIDPFEAFLKGVNDKYGCDVRIASGGGRMVITMDRYGANWDMVRKGWEIHVHGNGEMFSSAHDAVESLRKRTGAIDQDLPGFVISDDGKTPVGAMADGDSVVLFNFRGDRAQEITLAFDSDVFEHFDRGMRPKVMYAGMMEYDGDLHIPKKFLVNPPEIDRTMGEYLSATGVRQLAISETQKFGHVTYFFNGNRSGKFSEAMEDYVEIPSDIIPFEQRPWMKAAEITDKVVEAIESGKYQMIRLNFPNGDMVGHTGNFEAVECAMMAVDLCVARIRKAVAKADGVLVITADHGNADDMLEHDKKGNLKLDDNGCPKRKTSHSLNPVPCIVYGGSVLEQYQQELKSGLGISSLAATCMELLGYSIPEGYDPSVLNLKK